MHYSFSSLLFLTTLVSFVVAPVWAGRNGEASESWDSLVNHSKLRPIPDLVEELKNFNKAQSPQNTNNAKALLREIAHQVEPGAYIESFRELCATVAQTVLDYPNVVGNNATITRLLKYISYGNENINDYRRKPFPDSDPWLKNSSYKWPERGFLSRIKHNSGGLSQNLAAYPVNQNALYNNLVDRLQWISDIKVKLEAYKWQGNIYRLPLGKDTGLRINDALQDITQIVNVSAEESQPIIKMAPRLSELLRRLECLSIHDQGVINSVAHWMVNAEKRNPRPIYAFPVINAFYSMAKVHAIPTVTTHEGEEIINDEFILLLRDKLDHVCNRLYDNNYSVEPHIRGVKSDVQDQDLLALAIIALNMIPQEERSKIESIIGEETVPYVLETLQYVIEANKDHIQPTGKKFLFKEYVLQFLCWSLALEKNNFSKDEMYYLRSFFGGQRDSLNSRTELRLLHAMVTTDLSDDERKISKFTDIYRIVGKKDQISYDLSNDFIAELDFILEERQGGPMIFFEADGPFHFVRRVGEEATRPESLSGQTYLKTRLLLQRGRVVRMSSSTDEAVYNERISIMPGVINKCVKENLPFSLVDPENYPCNLENDFAGSSGSHAWAPYASSSSSSSSSSSGSAGSPMLHR